jgi:hypothetical protein
VTTVVVEGPLHAAHKSEHLVVQNFGPEISEENHLEDVCVDAMIVFI